MGSIANMEKRAATAGLADSWYYPGGSFYGSSPGGVKTKAGSSISEYSALQLSVVWCCIKILSEDSASLPLHLYRRLPGGGKERAVDHPLYNLLHGKPNPEMTAFSFRESFMSHILSWGNGYAEKEFGKGTIGRTQVIALWPITPNRVTIKRNEQKKIVYHISMAGTNLPNVILPKENVLHTPGLSFNGLIGYSPIAAAREAIGLGKALEEFGELYFGQGTHPGVVVSHPGQLSPTAHANLQKSLQDAHSGLGRSHRLLLIEEAMKIERIGVPNDEAQFLESRKYTNVDIGTRIYRLPPQMYGEFDKASTYASAEQFAIDYVGKALRSWLVRLEQSLNMWLLAVGEFGAYFWEHNMEGLLRGDIKSRYDAYAIAKRNGWLNGDDIREIENQNPMPDGLGKKYTVEANMMDVADLGKYPPEPKQPVVQP